MGGGSWTSEAFDNYTIRTRGIDSTSFMNCSYTNAQEVFTSRRLNKMLDPYGVTRECRDSAEHPNTIPIILGLDVTGSMGQGAIEVAKQLNNIMTDLYKEVKDVEFCVMGIGDLAYDDSPIQISQFESDIRIAEQLDKIYFESGGGGNGYESYTAAWYMGAYNCDLDCWKRNKKGIIITMGDEGPNPYLPLDNLVGAVGKRVDREMLETPALYKEVTDKFDVYHISVDDHSTSYDWHKRRGIDEKWEALLGDNYKVATLDSLAHVISDIVKNSDCDSAEPVSW